MQDKRSTRLLFAAVFAVIISVVASANVANAAYKPTESDIDPAILAIDEKKALGYRFDGQTQFIDDNGKTFKLDDLRGKPAILVLSYYSCDGACPSFNADLGKLLLDVEDMGRVSLGEDYRVITLSFDKNDSSHTARHFRKELNFPSSLNDNWIVGVFADPDQIKPFTSKISYKYFWSAQDRLFFHPNAFFFLSPEGRIVRVLHDSSAEPKDMELAIIATMFNKLKPAQVVTMAISLCYSYNYKEGKYGLNYPLFIAMGSLVTGVGAFGFGVVYLKKRGKAKEMSI